MRSARDTGVRPRFQEIAKIRGLTPVWGYSAWNTPAARFFVTLSQVNTLPFIAT
jgi:hypothetical protein